MSTRYGQLDARQASELGYLPAKVLLDGKEIRNVSVVNDIEGWIDVYQTDADGHIISFGGLDDPHTDTFRMYGDVVYIPKGQERPPNDPDGIEPESCEPATDSKEQLHPTLSIPLKYCTFEIWADQRTVATVFPSGHTCAGSRDDTQENRTEAESQGYTGAGEAIVWRSLVEHELLHNLLAETVYNRPSYVMETESGKAFHPSWLRYYEEAQVLAAQYEINTGRDAGLPDELPWMLEGRWKREIVPLLVPLWKAE